MLVAVPHHRPINTSTFKVFVNVPVGSSPITLCQYHLVSPVGHGLSPVVEYYKRPLSVPSRI